MLICTLNIETNSDSLIQEKVSNYIISIIIMLCGSFPTFQQDK
ncbi:unnamed protein product [Paramecium octaurelia]|uniref:Uncharacterized protein n=1 Tax=Paramecium octaurelia TaxID=43137 RepID=A0A8S1TU66_PAROT|nr:unnamed protein product [Paramecium octaurelia]